MGSETDLAAQQHKFGGKTGRADRIAYAATARGHFIGGYSIDRFSFDGHSAGLDTGRG